MTFIETTAPASARGEVLAMYRRQQQHWGYVPNYAKAFSARPEVLARWGRLLAEIRRPMSARRFELVTLAAALALRNSACALQHGKALTDYFAADEVRDLRWGRFSESFSEADRAIFEFSRQVATDATRVTSGHVDRLRELGFRDDEIFDIAAAAAGRAFFTKLLDGLGVEPDPVLREFDEPFRRAMTVGRAIACGDVERLPELPDAQQPEDTAAANAATGTAARPG